jgi:hypothetical protein
MNARMVPDNRAQASALLQQLEIWDNEKQLQAMQIDPYQQGDDWRPEAIPL